MTGGSGSCGYEPSPMKISHIFIAAMAPMDKGSAQPRSPMM
jgi:hypothetical protein